VDLNALIKISENRKLAKPVIRPIKDFDNGIDCPECGKGLKERGRVDPRTEVIKKQKGKKAKKVMELIVHNYGHEIPVFCENCGFKGHRPD